MSRAAAWACCLVAAFGGCSRPATRPLPSAAAMPAAVPQAVREKLLDGAVTVLGRLDQFDEAGAYAQVFDRLNQWSHARPLDAAGPWKPDPLVATLPERLRTLVSEEALAGSVFDAGNDIMAIRDATWLADIARNACRGLPPDDDLAVAGRLFDWTVRSLALVSDPPMVPTETTPGTRWMLPGEILLSGRASGPQRAWIFLELLRQAGLDGVMLATGDADAGTLRPWVPAVIAGGEAHLFDPVYGMPISGPGGTGIATARQAASDPAILAAMSLADRPYPVQAQDVAGLSALVAAEPWSLSRRMQALDEGLADDHDVRVAIDASAVAARAVAALPGGGRPRLWDFPLETLARRRDGATAAAVPRDLAPMAVTVGQTVGTDQQSRGAGMRLVRPLFAARVREFRGELDGPDGAKSSYLAARPSRQTIAEAVAGAPPEQADALKRLYGQMKEDATYWLGVLTLEEGEHEAAVDYLQRMTISAAPDSRWVDAARLNLAAALLPLGREAEAVKLLREDTSPQRFGSRLLADRLERRPRPEKEPAP
jgi:hypothetical protein